MNDNFINRQKNKINYEISQPIGVTLPPMQNNQNFINTMMVDNKEMPFIKSTKSDFIFFILTILSSFITISMGLFGGFKLGFTISVISFFLLSTAYLIKQKNKVSIFSLSCGFIALVASGVFAIYTDKEINFFLFCFIIFLCAIYLNGLAGFKRYWQGGFKMITDCFTTVFILPFKNIHLPFKSFFSTKKGLFKKNKTFLPVLIGIISSLPLLVIIVPILVNADVAFASVIKSVFNNFGEFLFYLILALIIAPFMFNLLFTLKKRLFKKACIETNEKKNFLRSLNISATNAFLCAVCLFYIIYLFSQLAYFFSAFSGILPVNYQHSENVFLVTDYAKRGFYEMCFISFINLALITLSTLFAKRENGKISLFLKIINTFLSVFTLILISTAISKMLLYINSYGLTRLRLLTSIFMITLAIVFIIITIRLYIEKFSYMKFIIIACSVILISTGYIDIDSSVAKYNISAYENGNIKELDLNALNSSSPSVINVVKKYTQSNNKYLKTSSLSMISKYKYLANMNNTYKSKQNFFDIIKSYNYSVDKAK